MSSAAHQPFREAAITINGTGLAPGHAMTLRIAEDEAITANITRHLESIGAHVVSCEEVLEPGGDRVVRVTLDANVEQEVSMHTVHAVLDAFGRRRFGVGAPVGVIALVVEEPD